MFCQRFDDHNQIYSVIVEDDGRTAYAYLLNYKTIVSDVWLYNCTAPSEIPEWNTRAPDPPFQNPPEYVSVEFMRSIEDESVVNVLWHWDAEKNLESVDVLFGNEIYGRIDPATKPGQAKLAKKNGPLARVLVEE